MDLTREEALKLHRQMWTDMQNELGDNPDGDDRETYKEDWCDEHGFGDTKNYCFLCEYSQGKSPWFSHRCYCCPVKWPTWGGVCFSEYLEDGAGLKDCYYLAAPISEILALPEREDV
jgi:hypothetical protein